MISIKHAALSDKGRVRPENEDSFACVPASGVYLVSDGMGGENAGEVASRIVAEVLPMALGKELGSNEDPGSEAFLEVVESAVVNLSSAVLQAGMSKPALRGMGATLTMLLVRKSKGLIVNLGDSRAYLLRNEKLEQVTTDHSVVQFLIDAGEITENEADKHPLRGQLLKCIGMKNPARPDCFLLELKPKDKLLLCSDGLTDMLADENIKFILGSSKTPEQACQTLVDKANALGGMDNITALVVQVARAKEPKEAAPAKRDKTAPKKAPAKKKA